MFSSAASSRATRTAAAFTSVPTVTSTKARVAMDEQRPKVAASASYKPSHSVARSATMVRMSGNDDYLNSLGKNSASHSIKASYGIQATDTNQVIPMAGNESSTNHYSMPSNVEQPPAPQLNLSHVDRVSSGVRPAPSASALRRTLHAVTQPFAYAQAKPRFSTALTAKLNDDVDGENEKKADERFDFESAGLEKKKDEAPMPTSGWYAWVVLAFVVFVRVMVQSQRAIFSFAYGYTGLGEQAGNAAYEIATAYPQLKQYFGLLTGLAYTLPFASFGLVVGGLTDTANRKIALSIVIACAAATMGLTGFCNSFLVLALMRVVHGMVNSASNPFSFSLITDYFPPDKRATANSIIHSGQYIGSALGSISILLIQKFGWRSTYGIMALISTIISTGIFFFVKEPERGRYMTEAEKEE